jgi:putative DNA primase/helicase
MTFEEILSRFPGPRKPNGKGGFLVNCSLGHDKKTSSLSITPANGAGPAFHCFGCGADRKEIIEAAGMTLSDILPPRKNTRKPSQAADSRTSAPITVSDLSNDKGIPEDFLRGLGIEDRPSGVLISYRLMDGSLAPRQRARTALSAKIGSVWLPGEGKPVPYGLDRLTDARKEGFLVLVEGESDCWTLWYHGFPALGIPGATMGKTLQAEYLLGIAEIYVWREPDKAGRTFEEKIPQRLREVGFSGQIWVMKIDEVKDPNELHKQEPEDFKATFRAALDETKAPPDVTDESVAEYIPPEGKITRTGSTSADLAEQFLAARAIRSVYWRGDVYRYNGTHYAATAAGDLKADVNAFLQTSWARKEARTKTAAEIIANVEAAALVPAGVEPPALLLPSGAVSLTGPYIALADGILDVETYLAGKPDALKPHGYEYFFLNSLPYGFSDAAERKCETWRRVLAENLPDPAYRNLLQEWFGLCCVQDTSFENFMLFPGEGGTGKTLTCTVLRAVLGSAAVSSVPLEAFNSSRTFPLAETVGKLANVAEEIGEIDKAAEGLLKQYVSGSPIQVERKHRDPFWLRPTARLTFATNVLPRFADRSNGVWRRMLILPFEQVVPAEKRDRRLIGAKFWEDSGELPGILAWALEGLRRLRERGHFEEPVECRKIREDYKRDSNPAGTFLADHCTADLLATTSARKLYCAYSASIKDMGHHALSEPVFAREVRRRFPLCEKQENATWQADGTRTRLWLGLKFHE